MTTHAKAQIDSLAHWPAVVDGRRSDCLLSYLPYIETRDGTPVADVIGWQGPDRGSWEEWCVDVDAAKGRIATLARLGAIEMASVYVPLPGAILGRRLVHEWSDDSEGGAE